MGAQHWDGGYPDHPAVWTPIPGIRTIAASYLVGCMHRDLTTVPAIHEYTTEGPLVDLHHYGCTARIYGCGYYDLHRTPHT